MQLLKDLINFLCIPQIMFTTFIVAFFFFFPINDWFEKWNTRLKLNVIWTKKGGLSILIALLAGFAFGLSDANFRLIVLKPDNIPIVGLIFLVFGTLWVSMSQALVNDKLLAVGEPPNEAHDAKTKILVWPDLVHIELVAMILTTALLILWATFLQAPLEEAANPSVSPNPSKAPWYFLGLQEMLVYFDPWLAGVVFPTFILVGLMAIPFIDKNPKGSGYYSFKERRFAISLFLFYFLIFWVFLILIGTFLRGPNWNFFGPFEIWDTHKLEVLNNVNLSELIYMIFLKQGLPENVLIREMWGFLVIGGYFLVLPPLLAKTIFKKLHADLGNTCFGIFIFLLLASVALPIKMYLRWAFNIKYLIAIPEFFFNI